MKWTKRDVAREGLIILCFLGAAIVLIGLGRFVQETPFIDEGTLILSCGVMLLIIGYPGYWLVKFIRWAVRTLKQP